MLLVSDYLILLPVYNLLSSLKFNYILIVVLLQELILFSLQVTILLCVHGSIMMSQLFESSFRFNSFMIVIYRSI